MPLERARDPAAPQLPRDELAAALAGTDVSGKARAADGTDHLVSYTPVLAEGRVVGAIEVAESMAGERKYLRTTYINVAIGATALLLLCGAATIWLGVWLVGKPIRSLTEQARRVGAGDLSARLSLAQKDEIGELAAEMNAMCDRLLEANRRAEAEVARRIEALEQLRHADRLATVGRLASGIAHELGAPLQVVSARAGMIADGDVTGREAAEYGRIIHGQAGRMASMIRQLLDFARRKAADKTPGNLEEIARKTCQLVAPIADKRGVALAVEKEPDAEPEGAARPARVMIDAEQIQQALTNLIVNGIQAMPRGSCARSRRRPCGRWDRTSRCRSTRASSRRPTGTWRPRWRSAGSARTSTTASTSCTSRCRRCDRAAATCSCSRSGSWSASRRRPGAR